ncbi:hypothetical protein FA15DRAFT_662279 [Coprinopsis marcescibilis]|uniref:Uncharacterized protein n=1 Tax=Coprinopsis marcescibilis TaxID=230819 RepID=A0A5C3LEG5_COPMA|nr:hypothetical protein FA15DRAFT_662279 [Coprinopsis marcescibilis]
MAESMDVDVGQTTNVQPETISQPLDGTKSLLDALAAVSTTSLRDNFREILVKVHIRRPEKDSWMYLGRGIVTQEVNGHSSRVVVRAQSSGKIITQFDEASDLQAEKRGNFVVIGLVDGSRVVSWSLNAQNTSETLRLLASIELACYRCKQAIVDPRIHVKARRRIDRIIKDDRRRRHRRRKDQDAMVDAFARQTLTVDNGLDQGPPVGGAQSS